MQNLAQFNAMAAAGAGTGRHMSVMMPSGGTNAAALRRMSAMNQPMAGSAPIEMPAQAQAAAVAPPPPASGPLPPPPGIEKGPVTRR